MPIESDWSVTVTDVPQAGLHVVKVASAEQRADLVKSLDILDCNELKCDLRVRSRRQGRYQVTGKVRATVTQACVISLEPIAGQLEEPIDVEFWPADQITAPAGASAEEVFDPDAPDGAERIEHGQINIGQLVFETVSAGLDPYPRRAGAALEWTEAPETKAVVHPFAALAKLKKSD
jgi:uncharacterized metal-binding protein YceD (DUF177 family)